MNPVTFNLPMEDFMTSVSPAPQAMQARILKAPLVIWGDKSTEDFDFSEYPEYAFPNGCPRLPMKSMRVFGTYTDLGGKTMRFKAWLKQIEQAEIKSKGVGPGIMTAVLLLRSGTTICELRDDYTVPLYVSQNFFFNNRKDNWYSEGNLFDCSRKRLFPKESIPEAWNNTEFRWIVSIEWIQKLCLDFYNPHLYMCKVTPPLPLGRNVLWQQAREHYVLLHKTHPANAGVHIGKNLVTDGPTVDRAAHSRRAHFRLLRSPKFTKKRGQRIWIQSSWVGPKEWTDHSGQIYKIVERTNPAASL